MSRQHILENFSRLQDKNYQDSHLAGIINMCQITSRRPHTAEASGKDHSAARTYKVRVDGKDIPVCVKIFSSLHGITHACVCRTEMCLVHHGQSLKDLHGKHNNCPNKYLPLETDLLKSHIKSFRAHQSHCSLRDSPICRYFLEDMTVKRMCSLFLQEYQLNMPYKVRWTVFSTHFNMKFGFPHSDRCRCCDEL